MMNLKQWFSSSIVLLAVFVSITALIAHTIDNLASAESTETQYQLFTPQYDPVFPDHPADTKAHPSPAADATSAVQVAVFPIEMESDLFTRKFTGYTVTVSNHGPQPVTLVSSEIRHGQNGHQAYDDVKRSLVSPASLLGITGVVTNTFKRASENAQAKGEADKYANALPATVIEPGQSVSTKTLVPFGKIPQVKVKFKDSEQVKLQYQGFVAVRPIDASFVLSSEELSE